MENLLKHDFRDKTSSNFLIKKINFRAEVKRDLRYY